MCQETIDDVNEIIKLLGNEAERIPENIVSFFDRNSSKPYVRRIKLENGLENQNFSLKTCAILKYISTYLK